MPPPTKVITIGALKGGVGKTTLAVFLACVYAMQGRKVLYVCADSYSQTGVDWWTLADEAGTPMPYDLEHWPSPQVAQMIKRRALGQYDMVIVDTGGASDKVLHAAIEVSTFVLIVASTSPADVRRLPASYEVTDAAARMFRHPVDMAVVFTMVVRRRVGWNTEMRSAIERPGGDEERGLPVLDAFTSFRAAYRDALGTVPSGDDLREVEAIAKEIDQ